MEGTEIIPRTFNDVEIGQRQDGYLNATAMCKAGGRLWADYWRLGFVQEFLAELSADMGIPISDLVQVRKGGTSHDQGTWVCEEVAVHLAGWISSKFAVQVSKWIKELLREGMVRLADVPVAPPVGSLWSQRYEDMLAVHQAEVIGIGKSDPEMDYNCFTVLTQAVPMIYSIEHELIRHCLPVSERDRPDGSIGATWSTYRSKQRLADHPTRRAILRVPTRRGLMQVSVHVYPGRESSMFARWLAESYLPSNLPAYLLYKFQRSYGRLPPLSVANQVCVKRDLLANLRPDDRKRLESASPGIVRAGQFLPGQKQLTIDFECS